MDIREPDMLTDNEILTAVSEEVIDARGYDSDELAANRIGALNYYYGYPRGDEVEGRSDIQSLDVADHVNATMAQLAPMMKATLLELKPVGEDDEDQAQLESDVVLDIAEQSDAYTQFSSAAFDALLQRNGWIHCYVDEIADVWEEEHQGVSDEELTELLMPVADNDAVEVISQSETDEGMTLTIKHTMTSRELKIEAVAPEYMLYAAGHKTPDVSNIRFLAERKLQTRSELIESGLPKSMVEDLPTISYENWVQANAREVATDNKVGGQEPSTYVVETYDAYIHLDVDEDGIAELWRVRVAGYDASIFLDKERARFIPYCTGSARPMAHRTAGTSLYDALRFVQDGKTHSLRQLLDNSNVANNMRFGFVEGEVNMEQALTSRPGQGIGMRSEGALFPIPFNDVGPSIISTLDYLDTVATSRAGAAADMMQGEFQIAGTSAAAANGEIGHKEKMSAFFARNLINSLVKGSFMLIHQALRSYYGGPIDAKLGGEWVKTDPRKWLPRRRYKVIPGLSSSERRELAAAQAQNIQYQSMAMQAGLDGVLVTPEKIHNSLRDWLRTVNLDQVDSYYVDPGSAEGQQAAQAKQQSQQQQQQQMEQLQQRVIDQEQALDKYKHDSELAYKRWSDELQAQVDEMKVTGQALGDMEVQAMKNAEASRETEAA